MPEPVLDSLLGTRPPEPPDRDSVDGWRAYFIAAQSQLLRDDPAMTPAAAHAAVLARVREQHAARFPGGEAELRRHFSPA